MLEHATEVKEIWKLDRGRGDYSPVPVAHIKMIILGFCPNLGQNLNIKATSDMFPMVNKFCREGKCIRTRGAHQLLYIYPRCLLSSAVITGELSKQLPV